MGWPNSWTDVNQRIEKGEIDAYRKDLDETLRTLCGTHEPQAIQWAAGGLHSFQPSQALRPILQRGSNEERRPIEGGIREKSTEAITEECMRDMRYHRAAFNSPRRQELEEQRSVEFENPLLLVSHIAASLSRGDTAGATEAALRVLRQGRLSGGSLQHMPNSDQAEWDALSEHDKAAQIVEAAILIQSKYNRPQRLKCCGNGVVAAQASFALVGLVLRMRK